jgi:hypothetical protein
MVTQLLGGRSLASVAGWADDIRNDRRNTYNWHFADIPIKSDLYEPDRDCKVDTSMGDCAVAELLRLKSELRCATEASKVEALKFAVHFVGDIHQPMHTVLEDQGGNLIRVDLFTHGLTCTGTCIPTHSYMAFHAAWDTGLIQKTVRNWGAYVDRLETGWLKSKEANHQEIAHGTPSDWAVETHRSAQRVWNHQPANNVLDDRYYNEALLVIDRQLGVAGLRLARFLNGAYAATQCPLP